MPNLLIRKSDIYLHIALNVIRLLPSIHRYKSMPESMINRSHISAPTRAATRLLVKSQILYVINVFIPEKNHSNVNIATKNLHQDLISNNIYKSIRKMTVETITNASSTGKSHLAIVI